MTTYPSLQFKGGVMLWVLRSGSGIDAFGDGNWREHHQIGPCHVPVEAIKVRANAGARETRAREVMDIRAPIGSDIVKSDRILLPNGIRVAVICEPFVVPQPFTGWLASLHFQCEEVG